MHTSMQTTHFFLALSLSLWEHFHLLTSRFFSRISFSMRLHLNDRIVVCASARARTHACKRSQTTIKRKAHLTQPRTASTGMRFKCICQQHTITFYGTLIPKIVHFFVIQFWLRSNNFNNFWQNSSTSHKLIYNTHFTIILICATIFSTHSFSQPSFYTYFINQFKRRTEKICLTTDAYHSWWLFHMKLFIKIK